MDGNLPREGRENEAAEHESAGGGRNVRGGAHHGAACGEDRLPARGADRVQGRAGVPKPQQREREEVAGGASGTEGAARLGRHEAEREDCVQAPLRVLGGKGGRAAVER